MQIVTDSRSQHRIPTAVFEAPPTIDVRQLIIAIRAQGKSVYYIAKLMRRQVVQIQRMEKSGRCQPHERDMLLAILDDCLQNVTIKSSEDGEAGV